MQLLRRKAAGIQPIAGRHFKTAMFQPEPALFRPVEKGQEHRLVIAGQRHRPFGDLLPDPRQHRRAVGATIDHITEKDDAGCGEMRLAGGKEALQQIGPAMQIAHKADRLRRRNRDESGPRPLPCLMPRGRTTGSGTSEKGKNHRAPVAGNTAPLWPKPCRRSSEKAGPGFTSV